MLLIYNVVSMFLFAFTTFVLNSKIKRLYVIMKYIKVIDIVRKRY